MKYIKFIFFIVLSVNAEPGCMQIGNRLMKYNDSKALNYVSCLCPCNRYESYDSRNQCSECKHYHMPRKSIFLKGINIEEAYQLAKRN